MIRINKQERKYLIAHGCRYPKDLHSTIHGNTYATESHKVLNLLKQMYGK